MCNRPDPVWPHQPHRAPGVEGTRCDGVDPNPTPEPDPPRIARARMCVEPAPPHHLTTVTTTRRAS